jgi:flagellar hook protein FlgE
MIDAINTAVSGLNGFTKGLQVISNNVTNMDTPGFKGSDIQFEDQLSSPDEQAGSSDGGGLNAYAVALDLSAGQPVQSNNPLAVAVNGNGLFVVQDAQGHVHYTRDGDFQFNAAGYLTMQDGTTRVMSLGANGALSPITLSSVQSSAPHATSTVSFTGNLSSTATTDAINSVPVYDAGGGAHDLSLAFAPASGGAANTWTVTVSDGSTTVATGNIAFSDGEPVPAQSKISFTYTPTGGQAQNVTLDFSTNVTSFAAGTSSTLAVGQQDGYTAGTLTNTTFDNTGALSLTYSNGQSSTGPQLALATYGSASDLTDHGNNEFDAANGALLQLGHAGDNGFGSIQANEYEGSNVDLSSEFSELIVMQRGYQASSQLISTANQMLQQLFSMDGQA